MVDRMAGIHTTKCSVGYNGPVTFSARLIGEEAMYREHLGRISREVENAWGVENGHVRSITTEELDSIDSDPEVRRYATMGKMNSH